MSTSDGLPTGSATTETKMKDTITVVELALDGAGGGYTVPVEQLDDVLQEIRNAAESKEPCTFSVRIFEMPRDEYDSLPEFDGF